MFLLILPNPQSLKLHQYSGALWRMMVLPFGGIWWKLGFHRRNFPQAPANSVHFQLRDQDPNWDRLTYFTQQKVPNGGEYFQKVQEVWVWGIQHWTFLVLTWVDFSQHFISNTISKNLQPQIICFFFVHCVLTHHHEVRSNNHTIIVTQCVTCPMLSGF